MSNVQLHRSPQVEVETKYRKYWIQKPPTYISTTASDSQLAFEAQLLFQDLRYIEADAQKKLTK